MTETSKDYDEEKDAAAANMRAHAITTIRYKVYIFLMIVFLVFFRPVLIETVDDVRGVWSTEGVFSLADIANIWHTSLYKRWEWGKLNKIDEIREEIEVIEKKKQEVEKNIEIISLLGKEGKRNTIINCLNLGECTTISEVLIPYLPLFRTYLLIDQLQGTKMKFDQKILLQNINDFLLKTNAGVKNATMSSVKFGDPSRVHEEFPLYKLPVGLALKFESKTMLMSFLHNIEERVSFTIPVLYKIEALKYDIVKYTEPQSMTVALSVYYIDIETTEIIPDDDTPE